MQRNTYLERRELSPLRKELKKKQDTITVVIAPHGIENPYHFNITRRLLEFIRWGFIAFIIASGVAITLYLRSLDERDKVSEIDAVWQNRLGLMSIYREQFRHQLVSLEQSGDDLYEHVWGFKPHVKHTRADSFFKDEFSTKIASLRTSLGFLMTREAVFKAMPIGMPLDNAYISSLYGERISPFGMITQFHTGMDFANATGSPIKSAADGEVINVTAVNGPGLGIHAKVLHKYGFMTVYGHMSELKVEEGQKVKRGDVLGLLGQTGTATGPHLHYEVHLRYETKQGPYSIIMNPWLFVKEEL